MAFVVALREVKFTKPSATSPCDQKPSGTEMLSAGPSLFAGIVNLLEHVTLAADGCALSINTSVSKHEDDHVLLRDFRRISSINENTLRFLLSDQEAIDHKSCAKNL